MFDQKFSKGMPRPVRLYPDARQTHICYEVRLQNEACRCRAERGRGELPWGVRAGSLHTAPRTPSGQRAYSSSSRREMVMREGRVAMTFWKVLRVSAILEAYSLYTTWPSWKLRK